MTPSLSLYVRRFFSGTFLSRLSGMTRDLAMAFAFGDHPSVAAFMVAFRFSNLFRRLLSEGPFQSAFIPYFEGIKVQDPAKAALFFRKLTSLMVILLLIIIIFSELIAATVISFFNLPASSLEVVTLMAWMLPGLLFICLYGLNISLLHCHDNFFLPSFAPFICNTVWIAGALFLKNQAPASAMITLAKLIVIGFFGQWLITLPPTLKYASSNFKEWINFKISPEVKGLAKSFAFGAIGVGAVQINALLDSVFARYASLQGPVYLWYSIRLEQLALAIFGIACVSTVVPRLSRAIKSGDEVSAQGYFSFSFKRILAVMIPCTFAIIALGGPAVNLLYGRGHFSDVAVSQTTFCLWSYGLGLVPTTMIILFSSLFYARGDFRTPTIISIITVLLNLVLNALFVFGFELGAISTALATSASAWINCWVLVRLVHKKNWVSFPASKTLSLILASGLALGFAYAAQYLFFSQLLPRLIIDQLIYFSIPTLIFIGGLGLFALLLRNQLFLELFYELLSLRKKQAPTTE